MNSHHLQVPQSVSSCKQTMLSRRGQAKDRQPWRTQGGCLLLSHPGVRGYGPISINVLFQLCRQAEGPFVPLAQRMEATETDHLGPSAIRFSTSLSAPHIRGHKSWGEYVRALRRGGQVPVQVSGWWPRRALLPIKAPGPRSKCLLTGPGARGARALYAGMLNLVYLDSVTAHLTVVPSFCSPSHSGSV